jgi:hypothetical protein
LACHLHIDADPDPVLDPAYHFDTDPDPPDPGYQMMRIRIHHTGLTKFWFGVTASISSSVNASQII